jgi:ribosome-associated protein
MPAREADPALDEQGRPSKSQRKRDAHDLQALGAALAELPPARLAALQLPDALADAIAMLVRTRTHEGRRRQRQFVGKLMRGVDPAPLHEAVAAYKLGGATDALALHQAEAWRAELIADDTAVVRWMAEHPSTEASRLRALVKRARDEHQPQAAPGVATRQGRAWRELFRFLRASMASASHKPDLEDETTTDPVTPPVTS